MEKKHLHKAILFFPISFIVLIITFLGTELYCLEKSKVLHTYNVIKNTPKTNSDDIFIEITVSKQWDDSSIEIISSKHKNGSDIHQDKTIGAQYDGVLINNSKRAFKNWSVKLEYSEDLIIDSTWNGDYSSSGNQVNFIARDIPAYVNSDSSTTFGAVMYSNKLMSLKSYKLEGYKEVILKDLPFFWMLITLSITWCFALISYFIITYKTISYRNRVELDSKIISQSFSTLTNFIDAKDAYTKNHSKRVAIYSAELGRRLNMDKGEVNNLYYIALMHDCGKIGIPDNLLNKKGKLSKEEYRTIQLHTELGDNMLADFTAIPNIRDGAHYHHEHFDGNGYPEGLKGVDIPLCARIICVADSYDAMSSTRCYRRALSEKEILSEMLSNSGKQFDPEINQIMISLIKRGFVNKIKEKYPIT